VDVRFTALFSERLAEEALDLEDCEFDTDLEVVEPEPDPPLLACAKALD
jgi:hypothetical protein